MGTARATAQSGGASSEGAISVSASAERSLFYFPLLVVVCRHFWEVVASMSQDQQEKLLLFVTGSDRVPVGGVSEMKFKICKVPFRNASSNDMLVQTWLPSGV